MAFRGGRPTIRITADSDGVNKGVKEAEGHLGRLEKSGQKTFGQLKNAAKVATAAVGGGLVLGVGQAARATIEFDKSMRNVNSIAQMGEKRLRALNKAVLDLSKETAQAPNTLAEGLYDLVSSGFDAKESLDILRSSAKAATAGLTTTEVSTKAVAAVLNAYRRPAEDAAEVSDVLFRTVDRGVISFEDLASNIGDVLPFASSLGVELEEVGAAAATLTKAGIQPAEAMTRLKGTMTAFIKPSADMKAAIEAQGFASGEALIKAKGLQGALDLLAKSTGGSKAEMAKLFPDVRGLGGALALTGKNSKQAAADLKGMGEAAGATEKALSQQQKSLSFQLNKMKTEFTALGVEIGMEVVPQVTRFIEEMRTGEGAGGDFADAAGRVADVVKDIGVFLKDHPALVAAAAGAWVAYKTAALVALAVVNVKKFRAAFAKGTPVAAEQGAVAGRAYSSAFTAAASTGVRGGAAKGGKLGKALVWAGRGAGVLFVASMAYTFRRDLRDLFERAAQEDIPRGIAMWRDALELGIRGIADVADELVPGLEVGPRRPRQAPGRGNPNPLNTKKLPGGFPRARGSAFPRGDRGARRGPSRGRSQGRNRGAGGNHPNNRPSTPPVSTGGGRSRSQGSAPRARGGSGGLGLARFLEQNFGLRMTDGWRPQNAGYGAANSWHKQGSPGNPGAIDLVGSMANMRAAQAWVAANVPGIAENDIHDWGSGLHLHIGGPGVMSWNGRAGAGTGVTGLGGSGGSGGSGGAGGGPSLAEQRRRERLRQQRQQQRAHVRAQREAVREHRGEVRRERESWRMSAPERFDAWMAHTDLQLEEATTEEERHTALIVRGFHIHGEILRLRKIIANRNVKPRRKAAAKAKLAQLLAEWREVGEQINAVPEREPLTFDHSAHNAALALAGLTEATDDDLAALQAFEQQLVGDLATAQGAGDNDAIAQIATLLAGVRDDIKTLTEQGADQIALLEQRLELEREKAEELKRSLAVSQAQYPAFMQGLADFINGQIGGRALIGLSTPSYAGGVARL